jgi:glycosyltransferase involved in cell wall biosynthesis/SAM-dependent methyltransferase
MTPKLFIVVGLLRRGGTERQMVELVRAAHPEHAECTVICLVDEGELAEQVRASGARVEVLGLRFPRYVQAIAKLVRLMRWERPDAIYALLYHSYVYTLPVARLARPATARVAGRRSMPQWDIAQIRGARRFRRLADRMSDIVIANSAAVRDAWIEENPRLRGRVAVVPNGIRLPDVEPAPPPAAGRLRVVCVASLIHLKGHAVLVEALALLAGRDDWTVDLVGDGPEREAIEARLGELGLSDRVTLHGSMEAHAVHALVRSSDIAVLPSLTEGLPNAVMEAMAHGVPVVASDVGGVRDLLGSGAGIVVPAEAPEPLADGLAALLDDAGRRASAGAIGRREIEQRYSVEAMRDATLRVIEDAIAARYPERLPSGGSVMIEQTTEQPRVAAPDDAFGFGRNWQTYVAEHLTPERERIARDSFADLTGGDLDGRYVLDIGSGSGLFSLAAHKLGAGRIVSIDVDENSAASTRHLRSMVSDPETWQVMAGSILDDQLVAELEPADIVYSWGVLHHTGRMWKAIENAARLVKPGGRFVIAIYNRADAARFFNSERWQAIKRFYNHSPRPVQVAMELGYRGYFAANKLRQGQNPRKVAEEYRHSRGMALKTDLIDWLGGYPYEYASVDEIVSFCERLGLRSVRVDPVPAKSTANNEFVFERPATSS